jgi:hypothetical protein
MSPNSLRVLAGAAAAVIVLLTGIAVGFIGAAPECPAPTTPAQQATPTPAATSAAPTGNPNNQGGINDGGNNNQNDGSLGGGVGRDRATPTNGATAPPDTRPQETGQATDQAAPGPQAATAPACEGEEFSLLAAAAGVAGAGLASVTLLAFLMVAQSRRPVVPVSGPPAAAGPSRGADPRLDADRAALVRACIYVRDRVTSRALADRLAAALRDAGVNVVEPVGERFDPARHEAGGATPAKDPTQTGTIAAVEVPGYVDRSGRVLRAPVVTVYQGGPGGQPAQGAPPGANPALSQPSGAYPTVNPPSGAYPTVSRRTAPGPSTTQQPRRRGEEDR